MGAGVLLSDDAGRVLLVEPTYKDDWEIPGGGVEADESPYTAAVRELKEELGLPVRPGRLLVTDWVPPRPERTEGLMLVFDGGVLAAGADCPDPAAGRGAAQLVLVHASRRPPSGSRSRWPAGSPRPCGPGPRAPRPTWRTGSP